MSDRLYSELTLERFIKAYFGVDADIRQTILLKAPVGHTGEATLFLTTKKQLYLHIAAQSKITLGDVKKIIARMGLKAEYFVPPKGRPAYFDEVGREKFCEVFPGRKHVNNEDIIFYRTLATYNPALVLISEVRDGQVYQFDSDARTSWRPAVKFTYRRIRTS